MKKTEAPSLSALLAVITVLRSPEGCPWDRQQKNEDIGRYLLEEAYEVIDAIERKAETPTALREELGDLLFQIIFLAEIAEEKGEFTFSDVIKDITEKMIRRHPHIFGGKKVDSIEEIKANWHDIKTTMEGKKRDGLLSGIPRSLPALHRASKVMERASSVGFDWDCTDGVLDKLHEEIREFEAALREGRHDTIEEEIGDIFLCLINLCRFIHVDAEIALRAALEKFCKRFSYIEAALRAQGKTPTETSLPVMDHLWNQAKNMQRDDLT